MAEQELVNKKSTADSFSVPQTVKDVLEALMSDNLVEGDKIGAGNFYWSLPSKAYQNVN